MDQYIIGYDMIVKGKISNVRWLEQAPYRARKVFGGKFWHYALRMMDVAAAEQLQLRLEGEDLAAAYRDDDLRRTTGVWVEMIPILDEQRMASDEQAEQVARDAEPIHAGWQGIAEHLHSKGETPTNERCRDFAEQQLDTLWRKLRDGLEAREVQGVLSAVSFGTNAGAAAIYAEHKARLQELAQKARGRR